MNIIKTTYNKSALHSMLNIERFTLVVPREGTRWECSPCILLFSIIFELLASAIREGNKKDKIGKEENKVSLVWRVWFYILEPQTIQEKS